MDSGKTWTTDQWKGKLVALPGSGFDPKLHLRLINGNTGNTLTTGSGWAASATPAAGSPYQILSVIRRYVALIDRTNCWKPTDLPNVLMFSELH
jgi:hypothetical protein